MYCPHCMEKIDEGHAKCPYCGKDTAVRNAENALPVGSILSGRFYVGAVLGQGGFGITYVGCDTKLNKKIAIKEYYPAGYVNRLSKHSADITVTAGDDSGTFEHEKQKFIKEAYLLAEFAGDRNIVNVTDILVEHNTAYIIMEFVEGETLERFLKQNGKMTFEESFSLLEPMLDSLSKVHAKGLIHRDISPANIMIQPGKFVTLIDFGAAREYDAQAEKSLSVILKHGYAPTEQYMTKGPQGPWTDVYAVCATLYKMITGITPPSAIDRMVGDTLKKPSAVGADILPSQEAVLMKGLSVLQSERFSSMADLKNALLGKESVVKADFPGDEKPSNQDIQYAEPAANTGAAFDNTGAGSAFEATSLLTPGSVAKQKPSYEATELISPDASANKEEARPVIPEPIVSEKKEENKTAPPADENRGEGAKQTKKQSKTPIIIGTVAAAGVIAAVFAYMYPWRVGITIPDSVRYSEEYLREREQAKSSNEEAATTLQSAATEPASAATTQETVSTEQESTKDLSPGSIAPNSYYALTQKANLTELMYSKMIQAETLGGNFGSLGNKLEDYRDVDLNGDGKNDLINRVKDKTTGDPVYRFEFSDGTSFETPSFITAPNAGEFIQFFEGENSNIDDILITHLTDSTGGPILSDCYYYSYDGAGNWERQDIVVDSKIILPSLKNTMDNYGGSYMLRDAQLTGSGLAVSVDYGSKDGADQTFDFDGFLFEKRMGKFTMIEHDAKVVDEYWPFGIM